jgi:signal transduction histidine kinase
MDKLLADLLAYSRVRRTETEMERLDTGQLIREAIDLLFVPDTFTIEIEEPMPEMKLSKTPFMLVMRNLISNATKHHHSENGRVWITARELETAFEFTVRDDGPGIASKYHDQIFEMFTTLEARDRVEGSGMGLALIKKILKINGGTIRVTSEVGEGAAFHFKWPKSVTSSVDDAFEDSDHQA